MNRVIVSKCTATWYHQNILTKLNNNVDNPISHICRDSEILFDVDGAQICVANSKRL